MDPAVSGNDFFGFDFASKRNSVDAGLCYPKDWRNGTSFCSLTGEECPPHFLYSSGRQEVTKQYVGSCTTSKNTEQTKIGQCRENGQCASVKELCGSPASFNITSENCEVKMDKTVDPPTKTKYGSCMSNGVKTCFWSFGDWCDDADPASFKLDDSCTCEHVITGACKWKRKDYLSCAVSEESCDEFSEWLPPKAVVNKEDTRCHLCREPPGAAPTRVPTPVPTPMLPKNTPVPTAIPPPTLSPIASPMILPTGKQTKPDFSMSTKGDGMNNVKNDVGALVGTICGAIIVMIGLAIVIRRHNKKRAMRAIESSSKLNATLDEKIDDKEII